MRPQGHISDHREVGWDEPGLGVSIMKTNSPKRGSGNVGRFTPGMLGIAGAGLLMAVAFESSAAPPKARPAGKRPSAPAAAPAVTASVPRYNRDVRPILSENCFACHGPDSAARKAELRLDRREQAVQPRGGRFVIQPGKPQESELVRRILGQGPVMPPAATHKTLTAAQIDTLKRWIAAGAPYEKHWSYLPPVRAALPAVKNAAWCRTPVDRFVLASLERAGLKPAPEADRRTLARRLSLDLTGLPPDPALVEQFVADTAPNAYEKLVDRLMAMSQWGEHRGRYWLDAARYADTHGIHFDNFREMWTYRDWVIRAFNANKPFDQFTIEQLAGDLLPNPTIDQVVATGFNRCNITTNEGGAIADEYLVLYNRDRTETTSQVWLGTTAGCAVCHDHKFDPLSQREFYQMAAFFNNTTQAAMDGNIRDTPPVLTVPRPEDRDRFEAIRKELDPARKAMDERRKAARPEFDRWAGTGEAAAVRATIPNSGLQLRIPLNEERGKSLDYRFNDRRSSVQTLAEPGHIAGQVSDFAWVQRAGASPAIPEAGDFDSGQSFSYSAWVRLPRIDRTGAVMSRMDTASKHRGWDMWVERGQIGTHIVNAWPDNAIKVVTREKVRANRWYHVCITYDGSSKATGVRIYLDGQPVEAQVLSNSLEGSIRSRVSFKVGRRDVGEDLEGAGIQEVRLYSRALSPGEAGALARGTRAAYLVSQGAKLKVAEKDELFEWWLPAMDAEYRPLASRAAALETEDREIRARGSIAHVMNEKNEEAMAYILFRGEYDRRKDPVKPSTPEALPPFPADFPKNRLGFARWLLLPEHPLTTRVTVNRFWQELFGTGLVRTAGDFGVAGELPSHPELLDWLAVDFREGDWDVKRFFKMLVTSAAYRQAAVTTPEKRLKDPQNRLISRGPRFRMDAEMVRDYALASSGLLTRQIGGPSVRPYQPDGVWEAVAMIGSNTRDYRRDTGDNLYRRSLYTFWKRAAPPASLDIFNAPNRETCVVRRERTNTPLQALVTMNDPQFVEAARVLAERALKEGGSTADSRLDFVARRVLARPFRADELPVVRKTQEELLAWYRERPEDARKLIAVGDKKADSAMDPSALAAWTMLVNQVLNLDEVVCK